VLIRPLQASDALEYKRVRLDSLKSAPTAFSSSWETTRAQPAEFFAQRATFHPDSFLFGAFETNTLIGICGGYVDPELKRNHIAYVVSMWLDPAFRGQGIAQQLLKAVLEQLCQRTATTVIQLSVTAGNAAAIKIYEANGFTAWGTEPAALCVDGEVHDEIHMTLSPQAIRDSADS
jgi:RimJ/RimL family protein N-acetyltransferase